MRRTIFQGITITPVSLSNQLMTVKVFLPKGTLISEHSHPNEQTSYIESGSLCYTVAGDEIPLKKGQGITIGASVPHSCVACEDTTDINTFFPPRIEYLNLFCKEEFK